MINIYRGITGPPSDWGGEIYSGLSLEEIRSKGICNSNRSIAQSIGWGLLEPTFRAMPGLPVYLNRPKAEEWLKNRVIRHEAKGLGVLACVEIQEELIANGTIRIHRSPWLYGQKEGPPLTLAELEAHRDGTQPISGECHIPDFPCNDMLASSTFFVPRAHTLDGYIDFSLEPVFMDLAELAII